MQPLFFLSDAHLGADIGQTENKKSQLLLSFFEHVLKNNGHLFILGDLFDFWFEYKHVIPNHYFPVLTALKGLTSHGIRIDYITGNHDFWLGNFIENGIGIHIHRDPLELEIQGEHLYLAHGDGLAKKDVGYRLLKRILRNPFCIRLFSCIHPNLAYELARLLSKTSRRMQILEDSEEDYLCFAREKFRSGFSAVILGHTHQPVNHREEGGVYLNIGDWISHFTYAQLENAKFSLKTWNG